MTTALPVLDLTAAAGEFATSPFADTTSIFLDFIRSARKSVHIIDFGFHLPELTDLLIEKWEQGLDIGLILDHSQAQGKAEAEELAKLLRGGPTRGPVPFLISVSPRHGQLVHIKTTVVDERWVELGSWNYSLSAPDQVNDLVILDHVGLAHSRLLMFDVLRAFAVHHEHMFQSRAAVVPTVALAADAGQEAALDPVPGVGQVHRADVAAPWLDNQPLPAIQPNTTSRAKRVRPKRVRRVKAVGQ